MILLSCLLAVEEAFGDLSHMSEMVPRPKAHPGGAGELEITIGPSLGNAIGLNLNDLAHHPTVNVFHQAAAFQQSLSHFSESFFGEKPVL